MHASNTRKKRKNPGKNPEISLHNQQAGWKFSEGRLLGDTARAWEIISSKRPARTREFKEIEVVLVTPSVSRKWHRLHFEDDTPTDVMTFPAAPLGSLVICPNIARKQKYLEQLELYEEVLTYIIHGLLHLAGRDDRTEADFLKMSQEQSRIRVCVLGNRAEKKQ